MPISCTFNKLFVTARYVSGVGSNNITVTLVQNGVDQPTLTCNLTGTTVNTTTTCSDTTGTVPVAAGDIVALHYTQTNSTPVFRIGVGTSCQ